MSVDGWICSFSPSVRQEPRVTLHGPDVWRFGHVSVYRWEPSRRDLRQRRAQGVRWAQLWLVDRVRGHSVWASDADVPPLTVCLLFSQPALLHSSGTLWNPNSWGPKTAAWCSTANPERRRGPPSPGAKEPSSCTTPAGQRSLQHLSLMTRSRHDWTCSNKAFPLSLQALHLAGREFRAAQHH